MRPLQLTMQGYRGYLEETTVRFGRGTTIILARVLDNPKASSNGGGKSSIEYALCTLLYGREPHGGSKRQLINDQAEGYRLHGVFGDDGLSPSDCLVIQRSMSRKGSEELEWWFQGQHCHGKFPVVQAELDRKIGISYDLFCNALFISRTCKAASFVHATPGERVTLLEEMVDDVRIKAGEEKASAVIKLFEEDNRDINSRILSLTAEESRLRQTYLTLQAQLQTARQQEANQQFYRAQRLRTLQTDLEQLSVQYTQTVDLEPVMRERGTLQAELMQRRQEMESRRRLESDVSLEGLQACPVCHQPVSDHIRSQRRSSGAALAAELKTLAEREQVILNRMSVLDQEYARRQVAQTQQQSLANAVRQKQNELETAQQETVADFTSGYEALVAENIAATGSAQAEILHLKTTLEANHARKESYRFWKEGFGKQGIRNLLLDDLRALMAHYAHIHLHQLAGDSLHLRFPQQSRVVKGVAGERFEIICEAPEGERDLCMFSDGEQWKFAFAIILGLGDAFMHGTQALLKFRLLDDPVGELDAVGQREFLLACEQLSRYYPIMITLPEAPAVDIQAHTINVVKRGYVSSIEAVS